jgi:hypothetical protein
MQCLKTCLQRGKLLVTGPVIAHRARLRLRLQSLPIRLVAAVAADILKLFRQHQPGAIWRGEVCGKSRHAACMFSGSVTFFGQAKENCCAMAMSMSFGTYTSAPAAPVSYSA